jgi:hypothetical protein
MAFQGSYMIIFNNQPQDPDSEGSVFSVRMGNVSRTVCKGDIVLANRSCIV